MTDDRFAPIARQVAHVLLGDPNKSLSNKNELRWGRNGSISVNLTTGQWFSHEENRGGGVLDLITRSTGKKGNEAFEWLRENGFDIEDRRSDPAPVRRSSNLPAGVPDNARNTATYQYTDENGGLLFDVHRFEWVENGQKKKTFRQRAANGTWSVKGVRQVPYRLLELQEAIGSGYTIFVVEGEKDAENLNRLGVPSTCNAMGAGKWPEELTAHFAGADVVILPDNDDAGRKHCSVVAASLYGVAKSVRVLDLPALPEKGDVSDWIATGGTAEALYDLVEKQAEAWPIKEKFKSHFHAVPWTALDDPGPEHEWLIKGFLTRGERSMCAGASQAGKSFFILDVALAVARGVPFRGLKTLKGGVIYQAGEGGRGLKKRLRAYRQRHGLTTQDALPFVLLPSPIDLYASEDQTDLFIAETKHWASTFDVPLELVVIDTLSAATPGANENASEDMSKVLMRCARICEATNAHVMLVHHMNAGGEKPRGHTSVFANLDNVISVKKVEGMTDADGRQIREATVTKQKDGEDGKSVRFVLRQEILGFDDDGEEITSCTIAAPNRGALADVDTAGEAAIKLTTQTGILLRAIHSAIADHGVPAPRDCNLPPSVLVVDWRHVRETFEKLAFDGEGETDADKRAAAIRQALKRGGETLLSKQIIGRKKPYVWLTGKKVRGFYSPPPVINPNEPTLPYENDEVI